MLTRIENANFPVAVVAACFGFVHVSSAANPTEPVRRRVLMLHEHDMLIDTGPQPPHSLLVAVPY